MNKLLLLLLRQVPCSLFRTRCRGSILSVPYIRVLIYLEGSTLHVCPRHKHESFDNCLHFHPSNHQSIPRRGVSGLYRARQGSSWKPASRFPSCIPQNTMHPPTHPLAPLSLSLSPRYACSQPQFRSCKINLFPFPLSLGFSFLFVCLSLFLFLFFLFRSLSPKTVSFVTTAGAVLKRWLL